MIECQDWLKSKITKTLNETLINWSIGLVDQIAGSETSVEKVINYINDQLPQINCFIWIIKPFVDYLTNKIYRIPGSGYTGVDSKSREVPPLAEIIIIIIILWWLYNVYRCMLIAESTFSLKLLIWSVSDFKVW